MYCYEIFNESTNEVQLIFGYSLADAFRRANISDTENWEVLLIDYED